MSRQLQEASATALFGSASRGDADHFSDRDLLLVDDDPALLRKVTKRLTAIGWSVAPYTFRRLEALASRGALFVQHVKLEGQITQDRDGRLRDILYKYSPLNDYSAEIDKNANLARLVGISPAGFSGSMFAADVLFVSFRNFAILSLAQKNEYCFSFEGLLRSFVERGFIAEGSMPSFIKLRELKASYRSGSADQHSMDVPGTVNAVLNALDGCGFPPRIGTVPAASVLSSKFIRHAESYLALRDLERRLIALTSLNPGALLDKDLARLQSWVADPRSYANMASRNASGLTNKMTYLARILKMKHYEAVA